MKTRILITAMLLLLIGGKVGSQEAEVQGEKKETVKIYTTPATRTLAESWATEYKSQYPDFTCELTSANLNELNVGLSEGNSMGFVMQQPGAALSVGDLWRITVGREVIVAVMNEANPFRQELEEKGISPENISKALQGKDAMNWNLLLQNKEGKTCSVYLLDDPDVKFSVSKFLNLDPSEVLTLPASAKENFIASVKNDKYAIGFCSFSSVVSSEKQNLVEGINLLPIDRNDNGHLDYNENFYQNIDQFKRSVWIGKYPHDLVYNIYAVASVFPGNEAINDFLNWIIISGQPLVEQSGFTELAFSEKRSNLEKLVAPSILEDSQMAETGRTSVFLWIFLIVVAFGLLFAIVIHLQNKRRLRAPLLTGATTKKVLNEGALSFPKGLYFDKTHTWVFMSKQGSVKFGIDEFIPNVTGEYTRVILKNPGDKVKRMEPVVTLVRKGKQITINSPVSGTIREVNEDLVADPFMVNVSPYEHGWVYKIEPSNWFREIGFFMLGDSYKIWIDKEFNRLKDFLACSLNIINLNDGKLVFQEGGEIMIHPLKELDPTIWEDFQNHFINTSDMY